MAHTQMKDKLKKKKIENRDDGRSLNVICADIFLIKQWRISTRCHIRMRRATRTTTVQHFQGGSTGSHVRSSSDHHHSNAESFLMSFSRLKNFSGDWPSDEWGTCWRGGQAQHRQGNSHQHHIFSVFHHISYFLQLPRPIRRSPKWPSSHDYSSEYSHYDHRVWIWPLCMNMTKA